MTESGNGARNNSRVRRNSTQTIVNTGLPTTKIDMTFVRQQKEIHARPRFSFLRLYNSGVSTIVNVSQMPVWRKWSNATSTRSRPDLVLNYPNWDSGRWREKIPQTGSWELARRMVKKKSRMTVRGSVGVKSRHLKILAVG